MIFLKQFCMHAIKIFMRCYFIFRHRFRLHLSPCRRNGRLLFREEASICNWTCSMRLWCRHIPHGALRPVFAGSLWLERHHSSLVWSYPQLHLFRSFVQAAAGFGGFWVSQRWSHCGRKASIASENKDVQRGEKSFLWCCWQQHTTFLPGLSEFTRG